MGQQINKETINKVFDVARTDIDRIYDDAKDLLLRMKISSQDAEKQSELFIKIKTLRDKAKSCNNDYEASLVGMLNINKDTQ